MMSIIRRKLVIVGDGSVGKTALLLAFCKDKYLDEYEATIFETYQGHMEIDNVKIEFIIWDTAGQEDYERLRSLSYPDSNIIIICFSIDNEDSLISVTDKWVPELRFYCPNTPIILVGCKKDLRNNFDTIKLLKQQHKALIKHEQGEIIAKNIGARGYFECSALTKEGIRDLFEAASKASYIYTKPKIFDSAWQRNKSNESPQIPIYKPCCQFL